MILKLKNGFLKMSDPILLNRAKQILIAMTGNAHFPDPIPTVAEMGMYVTDYTQALTGCKNGDRLKIAEKNDKRERLVHYLHQWSHYVLWRSNGVESVAISSGFSLAHVSGSRIILEKPKALLITSGLMKTTQFL